MGALTSLWNFVLGKSQEDTSPKYFGGNHQRSLNSVQGGTGAVNPPTFTEKNVSGVPNHCRDTLRLVSRKKGATVPELVDKTGKKKGTIYQEIVSIKKSGVKLHKKYEKPVYRFFVS
jgi:hypothetical protein